MSDDEWFANLAVREVFASDEDRDRRAYELLSSPAMVNYVASRMPAQDAYTIIDWIDSVNADPDVSEADDDEEATEWDEMSDYDLDGDEEDEEEEDWG